MPYITSIEKQGIKKGREEGRKEGLVAGLALALQARFGDGGAPLAERLQAANLSQLQLIESRLLAAESLQELEQLLD